MIIIKQEKSKKVLKLSILIIAIVVFIFIVGMIILKYHVEGESNLPFKIKQITIISGVDGTQQETNKDHWNLQLMQINDIYLKVEKNHDLKKQEVIKSIVLDNIEIIEKPIIGEPKVNKIQKGANGINKYEEENKEELVYQGAIQTNLTDLKIANQGGTIGLRYIINNIKEYQSNEQTISYNGELLKKIGIQWEQLKSKISFDIIIELQSKIKYKAHIELEVPNKDLMKEEISLNENSDIENIVFKRI